METATGNGRSRISGKLESVFVRVFVNGNIALVFSKGTLLREHHVIHTPIIWTKSMEALLYGHTEMDFTFCIKHCMSQ
jgi:hypothetical protein